MNASEAVSAFNVTESFSPIADLVAIESFYNTALNIVFVLYIPVMALMITLMWGFTPTAMTTFKFTVSNMVFWIAVALLYVAFFFRPMLVLPYGVVTVSGLATTLGFNLNVALFIGLVLGFNAVLASNNCFTLQCITVSSPVLWARMRPRHRVAFAALTQTVGCTMLAALAYFASERCLSEDQMRTLVAQRYPEVSGFLLQRRLTGFSPSDTLTLLPTAVTIIFAVLSVHLTLMHIATLKIALNRSLSGQHQHRATVAKNLSSRCILPVFLMTLPVIVASIVINFRMNSTGIVCAAVVTVMTCPMVLWSVVSLGFRPYRRPIFAVFRFWFNGVGLARAFGPATSTNNVTETDSDRSRSNKVGTGTTSDTTATQRAR
ncbi:hypothetical protein AAVH_12236 [Aphelenchoides avenae]|nr:hypothetical protein AAVH_12236 [Aphelenchus avenae]